MSEFSDVTAVNKIIGSSPGYVGYQDNYNVLTKLKEKQNSVLLLDEIDKAHPAVMNLLYQMLDEGEIKDAKNNVIHLNHCIIIMTSNLGFEDTKVGFGSSNHHQIIGSLKQKFSVSLLNRIDYVIPFNYLCEDDVMRITKRKLEKLKEKYSSFKYHSSLVRDIVNESQYQEYGARRIDKIIEIELENLVIDKLLNHEELDIYHLKERKETVS